MKKTFILSCLLLTAFVFQAMAQIQEPVKFKSEFKKVSDTEAEIVFTATIDAGWHVYSTNIPDGGPTPATLTMETLEGAELVGKLTPVEKLKRSLMKCSK